MDAARDPIADVAERLQRDGRWMVRAVVAAACLHTATALGVARWRNVAPTRLAQPPTEWIDVDLPKPPAPPRDEPVHEEAPSKPAAAAKRFAPAAAPAQASAVITKRIDPDDPIDLTADGFVIGSAFAYAGGQTTSGGASPSALQTVGAASAPPRPATAPSAAPSSPDPDRSRRAAMLGGARWNCPFPPEADADRIDDAVVIVRVALDTRGSVERTEVLSDPGHGFGQAAQRCADGKRWNPALDRRGYPIEQTVTVRVRFDR